MRVLTVQDQDLGGADAVIFLAGQIWWGRPFYWLTRLPGMHTVVDRAYRWIAAHRGCTHIACHRARPKIGQAWFALIALPSLTLLTWNHVAPWIFMWLMAGAIFLGCKWLTFWRAQSQHTNLQLKRAPAYFLLWAGMDAASFLAPRRPNRLSRHTGAVVLAIFKALLGVLLLFGFARLVTHPLLAGWIGMVGLICILHFGLFDLAAVAWRAAGVDARPIMNAPIKAQSLNEFWGRRWNGAFNQLVLDVFFRRFSRSLGTIRATLSAFLISGLLHELVISLPSGAGYGLPTAYFLFQGWGVVTQRSIVGRRFGLRRGLRGWIFTMFVTAAPAFWLFHPPFVRRVILPFMQTIGAL
jgi:hypothetical protein